MTMLVVLLLQPQLRPALLPAKPCAFFILQLAGYTATLHLALLFTFCIFRFPSLIHSVQYQACVFQIEAGASKIVTHRHDKAL
jgi:hypothetical protein